MEMEMQRGCLGKVEVEEKVFQGTGEGACGGGGVKKVQRPGRSSGRLCCGRHIYQQH